MKRQRIWTLTIAVMLIITTLLIGAMPVLAAGPDKGITIQDGILTYSAGHYLYPNLLQTGFDPYGYNYQGHSFKGSYANVYLGKDGLPPYNGDATAYLAVNPTAATKWYWPYRDDQVLMKWNDAWLSNRDCDGDGALDRHYGYPSYIGSGAWETNHQSGTYVGSEGKTYKWNYFCKIIAVPADAVKTAGIWYTAAGVEIGPVIWGEFAIIQEVYNDQGTGDHGLLYKSPAKAGVGNW